MKLLNVIGTVIFLGVVALALIAVLDVIFLRQERKGLHKPGRGFLVKRGSKMRPNTRVARERAFTYKKPDR
ncbi:hypothetical protein [Caballeronia sp. SBC2]|uniref:hypothetical protein n=1 Tax=Caballeronia sp. SBC2 TaxID=2705547 RepID=UPI0013E0FB90|nr:hypothetical protein [Caballeronia sp. SBC2]QIE24816.1 hypothetical protein SBC2_28660 [Caballeronia sp. SBC2]